MSSPPDNFADAVACHQAGDYAQAEELYRRALHANPQHVEARQMLGALAWQMGRTAEAIDYTRQAIALAPQLPALHDNLGIMLCSVGNLNEARQAHQQAIALAPDFAPAYDHLGTAWLHSEELQPAEENYRQALLLDPQSATTHYNLGVALAEQGRLNEAEQSYRRALNLQPAFAECRFNLGSTLVALRQLPAAQECFEQLLQADPQHQAARLHLAEILQQRGFSKLADETLRTAQQLHPENSLWTLRRAANCPAVFQTVDERETYRETLLTTVTKHSEHNRPIDGKRLAETVCVPAFNIAYHCHSNRHIKEAFARLYSAGFPQEPPPPCTGRPRVGLLVTDGHDGVFLRCFLGLLNHPQVFDFELVVICNPRGSQRLTQAITNERVRIVAISKRFDRAVQAVQRLECDVLYFWEIGSDAVNYLLPFARLAPIQCTGWGIPETSGIAAVDYYLSNELVETDNSQQYYTEQLICARTMLTTQAHRQLAPVVKPREAFGIDARAHVYLCAQPLAKFQPEFDALLAEILTRDPAGVLVVIQGEYPENARQLQQRFARTLAGVVDRVLFCPRLTYDDYLSLVASADVLLDPLYFGGGLTTYDGLSLSKPIVTLPTEFARGRHTWACYQQMGITGCTAKTPADYVDIAVNLGTDVAKRNEIAQAIRHNNSCLFDDHTEVVNEFARIFNDLIETARSATE